MSAAALVIGYGSPIRGDDAIGVLAAERLAAMSLPPWVQIQARHILTAELAEDLSQIERVVFLDAAVDLPPGQVRCQPLTPQTQGLSTMAHFHHPAELLAWAERLYGHAPDAWLITVGGASFDYAHCQLSPPAEAAIEPMIERVLELLQ